MICWFPTVENETVTLFPPHPPARGGSLCVPCRVSSRRLQTAQRAVLSPENTLDRTVWQRLVSSLHSSLFLGGTCVIFNLLSVLLSLIRSMFFASSIFRNVRTYSASSFKRNHCRFLVTSLVPCHPGSLFTVLPGTPSPVCCFLRSPVARVLLAGLTPSLW